MGAATNTTDVVPPDAAAADRLKRLGPELYHGLEKGGYGYRMLATMGWKEGLGLVRIAQLRRHGRGAATSYLCR